RRRHHQRRRLPCQRRRAADAMSARPHRAPVDAEPGRMQPLARLPVFLSLEGKRGLLAGGGPAAAWKAELLSACGARVDVYAEEVCDDLNRLAANPPRGPIILWRRDWLPADFANAAIAVGAFENDAEAARFAAAARA